MHRLYLVALSYSKLSHTEFITLSTTLFSLTEADRRYQCAYCLTDKHPYDSAALTNERKALSCEAIREDPLFKLQFDKGLFVAFKTCPGNVAKPWVMEYVSAFSAYKKGFLPFPGSYLDQPNKIIEIFDIIGQHLDKVEQRERKKQDLAWQTKK